MLSTLAKRIIPCLDIKNGQTVKGINFEALKHAGDPVSLARRYVKEGADELVKEPAPAEPIAGSSPKDTGGGGGNQTKKMNIGTT